MCPRLAQPPEARVVLFAHRSQHRRQEKQPRRGVADTFNGTPRPGARAALLTPPSSGLLHPSARRRLHLQGRLTGPGTPGGGNERTGSLQEAPRARGAPPPRADTQRAGPPGALPLPVPSSLCSPGPCSSLRPRGLQFLAAISRSDWPRLRPAGSAMGTGAGTGRNLQDTHSAGAVELPPVLSAVTRLRRGAGNKEGRAANGRRAAPGSLQSPSAARTFSGPGAAPARWRGGAASGAGRGPSGVRSFENDLCCDGGVSLGSKDWDLPSLPAKEEERSPVWQLLF